MKTTAPCAAAVDTPRGARHAQWPERLAAALALTLHTADSAERAAARAEAWVLLGLGILRSLRCQSRFDRRVRPEDLEDLASAKALELMTRLESGAWDPTGWEQWRLLGLLHATARHGLIDLMRRADRRLRCDSPNAEDHHASEIWPPASSPPCVDRVEQRAFAEALAQCALQLPVKSRRVWFLRVFYGLPTKEIAAHPEVRLREGHVDVLLQRARFIVRTRMLRRGFSPDEMPAGTFATLWEILQAAGWPAG